MRKQAPGSAASGGARTARAARAGEDQHHAPRRGPPTPGADPDAAVHDAATEHRLAPGARPMGAHLLACDARLRLDTPEGVVPDLAATDTERRRTPA